MRTGQPSRTALGAARARAVHQTADTPTIFDDPLAAAVVGAVGCRTVPGEDRLPPEARLFLAARHRFAEDAVAEVAEQIRQVVILGAGLDTFGYRSTHRGLRVFEVDHPCTQAWKRERLSEAEISVPDSLRFVPMDFETDSLADGLAAAGFDRTEPAFFIWLGVIHYLSADAVTATLRFIAEHAAPAQIVLDYAEPVWALAPENRPLGEAMARVMAELGEPWLSLFTADQIASQLRELGFGEIEDWDRRDMVGRYIRGRVAADRVGGHVLRAAHRGRTSATSTPARRR